MIEKDLKQRYQLEIRTIFRNQLPDSFWILLNRHDRTQSRYTDPRLSSALESLMLNSVTPELTSAIMMHHIKKYIFDQEGFWNLGRMLGNIVLPENEDRTLLTHYTEAVTRHLTSSLADYQARWHLIYGFHKLDPERPPEYRPEDYD